MRVKIPNSVENYSIHILDHIDNFHIFIVMKKSEKSLVNVLVLSSQKGCFLMAELLKNSGYIFRFVDS
jgi:hypothetical protein